MSPQARRSRTKASDEGGSAATKSRTRSRAKAKEAEDSAEDEADEDEGEEKSNGRKARSTEPFPSGEELYNAKYNDGMTWQEIRDNIDPRIRSPKGLALIAEYVIENDLADEHPEFSDLSELSDKDMAAAIVEWHDSGQGWSVLAARTGLGQTEVKDIYEDSGGENPGRVGGQRYGGGRTKAKGDEEEGDDNGGDEGEEEEKPKRGRSRSRAKASDDGDSKPASRSRRRSPSKAT